VFNGKTSYAEKYAIFVYEVLLVAYPSITELTQNKSPSDPVLFTTQRSYKSMIPRFIIFFILAYATYLYNSASLSTPVPLLGISPRLVGLIPFIYFLNIIRRHNDDLYIFELDRIVRQQGRYWFTYKIPTVKYADIRGIVVHQSFWARIFNYGDIHIGTSAQDQNEVQIVGVSEPYELSELIEEFRAFVKENLTPAEREVHND
jgi:hypothetical protein